MGVNEVGVIILNVVLVFLSIRFVCFDLTRSCFHADRGYTLKKKKKKAV